MQRDDGTGNAVRAAMRPTAVAMAGAVLLAAVLAVPGTARAAQPGDGVSEERLSLPEGPGSLEGIGENVSLNRNMGQMQYSVPIEVPQGFPGMTPELALTYSSGAGNSAVGVGWSLEVPSLERRTVRGLPAYTMDDEFAANGGDELVRIPGTDPAVYRARFEKGFVRYTWKDAGTGAEGYWTAEYPDGRIGWFGADATGTLVPKARVTGPDGTFRYLLVEMVDRYGHHVDYSYELFGDKALVRRIGWVFTGGDAQYEATFEYEDRTDKLSDCSAGFEELLGVRLSRVNVLARGVRIRSYDLAYEDPATSGGLSRLAGVQMKGLAGGAYPIHDTYAYQRALGVDCKAGESCARPYVVSMGSLGVDMQRGASTLVDLDGDGLPDVVDTSEAGQAHRIFRNVLQADGTHRFAAAVESAVGNQGGFDLASPHVQVLDVNGDGFADVVNAQTGQVLYNRGTGDWAEAGFLWASGSGGGVPDLDNDFDPSDGALRTVRFLDYDNDKRIDLVRSEGTDAANVTFLYRNTGAGAFVLDPAAEPIGAGFESDRLELNDMNGDGLQDVVLVNQDGVRYRLDLGRGHWGAWTSIPLSPPLASSQQAIEADLDDLNGDGLADLVLVSGNTVRYWINRNGASFDAGRDITGADVAGEIPERTSGTTVLQADMNGNGSSDIVWIDASGKVTYLELFPTRPNLLSRITNAIGRVTDVTYASSVVERARDASTAVWTRALPFPMTVVKSTDEWDELTKVHTVTTYAYHDGYHDGAEKRFRGYARVEGALAGDDLQEAGATEERFDVGIGDPYRAGLLLREEQWSGGRSIQVTTHTYADCDVAGVPSDGLRFPVRHVCETVQDVEHREGVTDATKWVTTRTTWDHDGYGNVTLESELGVATVGGGACEACTGTGYTGTPCGTQCLGDERYSSTVYVAPESNDGRWILDLPARQRTYGVAQGDGAPADDVYGETVTSYDGDAFVGLPEGKADHGSATRVTERVDATGKTRDKVRNRLDAHGNVVEALDPLGTSGGDTHRRLYTMDGDGLRVARVEILLKDADGAYRLRRDVQYDPAWDKPVESSQWMVVQGDQVQDARNSTYYSWDEFGRLAATIEPGDTAEAPSATYEYLLAGPASRVVLRERTGPGEATDLVTVRCIDGRGRTYQERRRISGDGYRVTGFLTHNLQGMPREIFDAYLGTGDGCDAAAPDGTLSQRKRYDALGREVGHIQPPAGDETGSAESRTVLGIFSEADWDLEDTLEGGSHADTPTTARRNGLDQVVAIERLVEAGGTPLVTQYRYDAMGRLAEMADPAGATRRQDRDLLGRLVKIDDPDSGLTTFEYDDADNPVRQVDGRGIAVRKAWDGTNRLVAEWAEADETGTRIVRTWDRRGACAADRCTNVAGHLASVAYPVEAGTGSERYGYTLRGKVSYLGQNIGGRLLESRTLYDGADRAAGNVFPTGRQIDVTLDGADRLVGIPGYITSVAYDANGLPLSLGMANGTVTTMAHDARHQLGFLAVRGPGGAALLDETYRRDRVGNLVEVADGRPDDGKTTAAARYAYDGLYRLTGAELDPGKGDRAETLSWTYDDGDRILKASSSIATSAAHVGDYEYGAGAGPHAVTRAGATEFQYDAAGHLLQRGATSYAWDFLGRMDSASDASGTRAAFAYGPGRERLVKREDGHLTWSLGDDFEVRDGTAITYVTMDDSRRVRIEEPAFAASVLPDLAPASGQDATLASAPDGRITAGDAWLAAAAAAGTVTFAGTVPALEDPRVLLHASARRMLYGTDPRVTYLHLDSRDSPVVETDDTGAVVARTLAYPYGTPRYRQGEADPHGFTGKEQDGGTGLVDFGARQYDPWTGRWTMPDPGFQAQDEVDVPRAAEAAGAYGYTDGNPVNNRDPDGAKYYGTRTSRIARLITTIRLWRGTIRPAVEWNAFLRHADPSLRQMAPKDRFTWKTASKIVKIASIIQKRQGTAFGAFVSSRKTVNHIEIEKGKEHLQQSPVLLDLHLGSREKLGIPLVNATREGALQHLTMEMRRIEMKHGATGNQRLIGGNNDPNRHVRNQGKN
jgi:RHS repeat-associated protein